MREFTEILTSSTIGKKPRLFFKTVLLTLGLPVPIFSLAERQGHLGSGLVGRGRRRGVQQKELRKGRLACRSEDATQKRAQSGWPRLSMVTNYSFNVLKVKQVSLSEVASGEGFFNTRDFQALRALKPHATAPGGT